MGLATDDAVTFGSVTVGTLTLADGSLTDSDGTISIGDDILNASGGQVLVSDEGTSEPSGKSDGYIGVALVGGQPRIYFAVEGALYYVEGEAGAEPEVGNPIGLLLTLTYAA